ncbi:hypothetical protein QUF96_02405 [Bacillus bombysepticus]|nr:hypothetical protein [Bacillus bombysepticus]
MLGIMEKPKEQAYKGIAVKRSTALPLTFGQLVDKIKVGEVAHATFNGDEDEWFVTLTENDSLRYCNKEGGQVGILISVTYSVLKADYEIIKSKKEVEQNA